MKKIYIIFLILNICTICSLKSQTKVSSCGQDSLSFINVNTFFKGKRYINKVDFVFLLLKKEVSQRKWTEGLCGVIFFAKIFDTLLAKDLDLNYSLVKNPPTKNSTMEPLPPDLKNNSNLFNLYACFLEAKEIYELYVIKDYYDTNENIEFVRDVNSVIYFGPYTHPHLLKEILLNNKYKHLTLEKMYKEFSDHIDK